MARCGAASASPTPRRTPSTKSGPCRSIALFSAAFRFLTAATIKTSCLWLGAGIAGVLWEVLQIGGGLYVNHVYRHATAVYSQFALVIALLVFLHLGAQMTLYAAEINVVVTRRLWPRSLLGPPEAPADVETLTALAKVEERHATERVEVDFDPAHAESAAAGQTALPADAGARAGEAAHGGSPAQKS